MIEQKLEELRSLSSLIRKYGEQRVETTTPFNPSQVQAKSNEGGVEQSYT